MKITKTFHAGNRAEWREWLGENHATQDEVWLIYFKGQNAKMQVSYEESVEEALCFGWIDSVIQKIDDEKYVRKFTPRRNSSRWSALNRRRVARMIQEGKMTEAGLAVLSVTDEKDDNGQTAERAELHRIPPPFLVRRLKQNKPAWDNFQALAPSYRRNYIGWICAAKTEETRDRRIKEAIGKLAKNEKLGMK
jgi:uncharacterized protein YdeI (YjbR/CyaY-like superfamily)